MVRMMIILEIDLQHTFESSPSSTVDALGFKGRQICIDISQCFI